MNLQQFYIWRVLDEPSFFYYNCRGFIKNMDEQKIKLLLFELKKVVHELEMQICLDEEEYFCDEQITKITDYDEIFIDDEYCN